MYCLLIALAANIYIYIYIYIFSHNGYGPRAQKLRAPIMAEHMCINRQSISNI